MSADEIRKLAEDCHKKSWCYGLDTIEHRIEVNKEQALLAYAAMVERHRDVLHDLQRDISAMNGYQLNVPARDFVEKLNYILKGKNHDNPSR